MKLIRLPDDEIARRNVGGALLLLVDPSEGGGDGQKDGLGGRKRNGGRELTVPSRSLEDETTTGRSQHELGSYAQLP